MIIIELPRNVWSHFIAKSHSWSIPEVTMFSYYIQMNLDAQEGEKVTISLTDRQAGIVLGFTLGYYAGLIEGGKNNGVS